MYYLRCLLPDVKVTNLLALSATSSVLFLKELSTSVQHRTSDILQLTCFVEDIGVEPMTPSLQS